MPLTANRKLNTNNNVLMQASPQLCTMLKLLLSAILFVRYNCSGKPPCRSFYFLQSVCTSNDYYYTEMFAYPQIWILLLRSPYFQSSLLQSPHIRAHLSWLYWAATTAWVGSLVNTKLHRKHHRNNPSGNR